MVIYAGDGLAENICRELIDICKFDKHNFIAMLYRTNVPVCKGSCIMVDPPIIDLEIGKRYEEELIVTLLHEIGHAQGLNHVEAIHFAYDYLGIALSRLTKKRQDATPHMIFRYHQSRLHKMIVDRIDTLMKSCGVFCYGHNNQIVFEGPYNDLLGPLEACRGNIYTTTGEEIKQVMVVKGTDFPVKVMKEAIHEL